MRLMITWDMVSQPRRRSAASRHIIDQALKAYAILLTKDENN